MGREVLNLVLNLVQRMDMYNNFNWLYFEKNMSFNRFDLKYIYS